MFIPFVIYMISAIEFLYVSLYRAAHPYDEYWYIDEWVVWASGIITLILWVSELYLEIIQWRGMYGCRCCDRKSV